MQREGGGSTGRGDVISSQCTVPLGSQDDCFHSGKAVPCVHAPQAGPPGGVYGGIAGMDEYVNALQQGIPRPYTLNPDTLSHQPSTIDPNPRAPIFRPEHCGECL